MFDNIADYLKKHYNLQPTGKIQRAELRKIILNTVGISLKDNEVSIHEHQAFLKTRPAKRSEILMRQVEVLEECKKNNIVENIRILR